MKTSNWILFAASLGSFLMGFFFGSFFFGMVCHENSHVLACLVFRLRIHSYLLTQVICETSSNTLVNTIVRLSGGIGQSLVSFGFFWYAITLEKRVPKQRVLQGMLFGFELAFLTIAFHGVVNAVWEGFLFDEYSKSFANVLLTQTILLACLIVSAIILVRRKMRSGSTKRDLTTNARTSQAIFLHSLSIEFLRMVLSFQCPKRQARATFERKKEGIVRERSPTSIGMLKMITHAKLY